MEVWSFDIIVSSLSSIRIKSNSSHMITSAGLPGQGRIARYDYNPVQNISYFHQMNNNSGTLNVMTQLKYKRNNIN